MKDSEEQGRQPDEGRGESSSDETFEGFEDEHLYDDWDDLATDPEEVSRLGKALEGLMPDIVKRGYDGLVKEDGLRSIVKEREIPREAVGFLLGQVDATKREVLRIVSREVRLFLQDVDLGGELTKILTSVSFEIKTEVRFIPNDAAVKPNVKNRVRMRGEDGQEETLVEEEEEFLNDDDAGDSGDEQSEAGEEQGRKKKKRRRPWSLRRHTGGGDDSETSETSDTSDTSSETERTDD